MEMPRFQNKSTFSLKQKHVHYFTIKLIKLMSIVLTSSRPHARRLDLSMHRSNMEYANT